jgi:hypothetical protein
MGPQETSSVEQRKEADLFALQRNQRRAVCELWTHQLGWELRVVTPYQTLMTQLCATRQQALATSEAWKSAMLAKAWK